MKKKPGCVAHLLAAGSQAEAERWAKEEAKQPERHDLGGHGVLSSRVRRDYGQQWTGIGLKMK